MKSILLLTILMSMSAAQASNYNVATNGSESNLGTPFAPFCTIQQTANIAQPGDGFTVREGGYRERIDPPRGGTSDARRITCQAMPGEKVVVTGSEPIQGRVKVTNDTWKATIPDSYFGSLNPYSDIVYGD